MASSRAVISACLATRTASRVQVVQIFVPLATQQRRPSTLSLQSLPAVIHAPTDMALWLENASLARETVTLARQLLPCVRVARVSTIETTCGDQPVSLSALMASTRTR